MTLDELERRLESLPIGHTVLVTAAQFRTAFALPGSTSAELHEAAHAFCARIGCGVQFIGDDGVYAVFTRSETSALKSRRR